MTRVSVEQIHLKYHNLPHKQHNHPPDFGKNLNAEILHKYHAAARSNPEEKPKSLHERLTVEILNTLPSQEREETAQRFDDKLSSFMPRNDIALDKIFFP